MDASEWRCSICLELLYKPCVNACGHAACFCECAAAGGTRAAGRPATAAQQLAAGAGSGAAPPQPRQAAAPSPAAAVRRPPSRCAPDSASPLRPPGCMHRAMNPWEPSACPLCRGRFAHLPRVCARLHALLAAGFPEEYARRAAETAGTAAGPGRGRRREGGRVGCSWGSLGCGARKPPQQLRAVRRLASPATPAEEEAQGGVESEAVAPSAALTASAAAVVAAQPEADAEAAAAAGGGAPPAVFACDACERLLMAPCVLPCAHVVCRECVRGAAEPSDQEEQALQAQQQAQEEEQERPEHAPPEQQLQQQQPARVRAPDSPPAPGAATAGPGAGNSGGEPPCCCPVCGLEVLTKPGVCSQLDALLRARLPAAAAARDAEARGPPRQQPPAHVPRRSSSAGPAAAAALAADGAPPPGSPGRRSSDGGGTRRRAPPPEVAALLQSGRPLHEVWPALQSAMLAVADERYSWHGVGCDLCGQYPIVGRRYRCRRAAGTAVQRSGRAGARPVKACGRRPAASLNPFTGAPMDAASHVHQPPPRLPRHLLGTALRP
jgi:hypothetical protein